MPPLKPPKDKHLPNEKNGHATYVGPREDLKGQGALIRYNNSSLVLIQFDDINNPHSHGWWSYPKDDWKLDEQEA